ncbi:MAG: hypothetical protein PVI03_04190 [Candidatus Thorarchaeota archaeon]|jgi:hypothetical protein
MVKLRRSVDDYTPEAYRFEEWLRVAHGETISQIKDIDQLIERLEEWLSSIDVYGSQQGRFAKALLSNLLSRNLIPTKRPKEIDIIRDFLVDRSGRKWLKTEERHLERLYKNPKVTTGYIARELGRSKRSIYAKARKIGVKRPENALTERRIAMMKKRHNARAIIGD